MQENRSFDQYFGTFPGVDRLRRQEEPVSASSSPGYTGIGSKGGKLLPFQFDGSQPIGQCVSDPTHNWAPQHISRNGGRNDLFYQSHAPDEYDGEAAPGVMGYYLKNDIRVHWKIAKQYTLCDRYYCSVLGRRSPIAATRSPPGSARTASAAAPRSRPSSMAAGSSATSRGRRCPSG